MSRSFRQFYRYREEAEIGGTNQPMVDPNVSPDDTQFGYGQKDDADQHFEHAIDAAAELLEALKKLQPSMPDENISEDIKKVTIQVEGLMKNLEAVAKKMHGDSEAAPPLDDYEHGQGSQSVA